MGTSNKVTTTDANEMTLVERVTSPTPKFFKTLRTIGLGLAALGGAILAAPVTIPAGIITIAGYITLAGGIMTAVSQTAVDTSDSETKSDEAS